MKMLYSLVAVLLLSSSYAVQSLKVPLLHEKLAEVVDLNLRQDYDAAEKWSRYLSNKYHEHPAGQVFLATTLLTRYDDLGGEALPERADRLLSEVAEKLESSESYTSITGKQRTFWRGLALLQSGYAARLEGKNLSAALRTREGANLLEEVSGNLDAAAMNGIYSYYLGVLVKGLTWIPFVEDNRPAAIAALQIGMAQSLYFEALYRTTLCWIEYDRQKYDRAEKLAGELLVRYPKNRIFRQLRADMLYRLNQSREAADIYTIVFSEYEQLAPGTLRYLSAAGNLFVLNKQLGKNAEAKKFAAIFHKPAYVSMRESLSSSLLKRLKEAGISEE